MLSGKSAIVTGSTSGIGLGIARGLAASGANVMLNGFGDASEIEAIREDLANGHNIKVLYSGANMAMTLRMRMKCPNEVIADAPPAAMRNC